MTADQLWHSLELQQVQPLWSAAHHDGFNSAADCFCLALLMVQCLSHHTVIVTCFACIFSVQYVGNDTM
jgi:hypothetical protein